MPTLHRPDVDIYYEHAGTGPPLLLIPGMLSDSATWMPVLPFLEPHFTLIRPDNRATGRMQDVELFSLSDCVDDLTALIEHLDLTNLHVAGHSMGGYLSLMLAEAVPDRIASMSLLASAGVNGPRNFQLFTSALEIRNLETDPARMAWLRALFPWLMSPEFFRDPNQLEAAIAASAAYAHGQSTHAMATQIDALTRFRGAPKGEKLPFPIQAVLADNDLLFPVDAAKGALKHVPDITFEVISDAAHSIHWEQPAAVAQAIRKIAS